MYSNRLENIRKRRADLKETIPAVRSESDAEGSRLSGHTPGAIHSER